MPFDNTILDVSAEDSTVDAAKAHLEAKYGFTAAQTSAFDIYIWSDPVLRIYFFFENPVKPTSASFESKAYVVAINRLAGAPGVPLADLKVLIDADDNSRVWDHSLIVNRQPKSQHVFDFGGPIPGGAAVSLVIKSLNELGFKDDPTRNDVFTNLHGISPRYVIDYTAIPGKQAQQKVQPAVA